MLLLDRPVSAIKGVGVKMTASLASAGIHTLGDLMYFLPKSYLDYAAITPINRLKPGRVSLRVKVDKVTARQVKRGLHITEAVVEDETGSVRAVWFNQRYRVDQLKDREADFYVSGEYGFARNRYVLQSPSVELAKDFEDDMPDTAPEMTPVYRELRGIKSAVFRKLLFEAKPYMAMVDDPLAVDPELIRHLQLPSLAEALRGIHFPKSRAEADAAKRRLAFDELLTVLLAAARNKHDNQKLDSWHIAFDELAAKTFVNELPFALTDAQRRAAWEVIGDFERGTPMNRLLQGDVGAGKTVVAGMAAFMAAQAGYQSAVLAPTEILARQHAETLDGLLRPFNINVGLLVGGVKPAAKKHLKSQIASGAIAVTVGTHALLQDTVEFHQLGFVAIDEQHRFGVEQRQKLLQKSDKLPHLLAMTATPIPRSLALTVYGELDVSILDQLPAGRLPIKTQIVSPNSREPMYVKIESELRAGRQAYVICPLIESTDDKPLADGDELKSVTAEFKRLQNSGHFKHRRIGLLHGQMKPEDKDDVMRQFAAHEVDILVSTTVVEVGVDVPNATVMLIEGADRFGLAQLHQLRGRVGRSSHQSYAYLVPATSAAPSERLRELERSTDGFYLAEKDLEMRGPGAIYGRAQHGSLDLRIARLTDTKLIKLARDTALGIVANDPELVQYRGLARAVAYYQRVTTLN